MNWELLSDGVLVALLLTTLVYAIILNKKLSALRNAKEEMQAMVGEFSKSALAAERALQELRERSGTQTAELQKQVARAESELKHVTKTLDDLSFLVEKGNKIADRLEKAITASRPDTPLRKAPPARASRSVPTLDADRQESPEDYAQDLAERAEQSAGSDDPRRAFLKALEAVR